MSDAPATESKKGLLGTFPPTFWMANVFELFERGAYYGLNALLAVYLADKVVDGGLGFQKDDIGLLQGVVYAATYIVPILGGALANRYGYRRMLLVAFSLLSAGYFLSGNVTSYWVIFATHAYGVMHEKIHASSVCSGTSDWMMRRHFSGSSPHAMRSIPMSHVRCLSFSGSKGTVMAW